MQALAIAEVIIARSLADHAIHAVASECDWQALLDQHAVDSPELREAGLVPFVEHRARLRDMKGNGRVDFVLLDKASRNPVIAIELKRAEARDDRDKRKICGLLFWCDERPVCARAIIAKDRKSAVLAVQEGERTILPASERSLPSAFGARIGTGTQDIIDFIRRFWRERAVALYQERKGRHQGMLRWQGNERSLQVRLGAAMRRGVQGARIQYEVPFKKLFGQGSGNADLVLFMPDDSPDLIIEPKGHEEALPTNPSLPEVPEDDLFLDLFWRRDDYLAKHGGDVRDGHPVRQGGGDLMLHHWTNKAFEARKEYRRMSSLIKTEKLKRGMIVFSDTMLLKTSHLRRFGLRDAWSTLDARWLYENTAFTDQLRRCMPWIERRQRLFRRAVEGPVRCAGIEIVSTALLTVPYPGSGEIIDLLPSPGKQADGQAARM